MPHCHALADLAPPNLKTLSRDGEKTTTIDQENVDRYLVALGERFHDVI
jgi:hypothetical protein